MKPYGCHSKPRKDGYWASDGVVTATVDGMWLIRRNLAVWVPDVMTKECNYRKTTPDPRCQGCTCP